MVVVLRVGHGLGSQVLGSSGLYYWLWDEEFVWGCGVYTDCWGWFADLVRQGLGLLWFANLVG